VTRHLFGGDIASYVVAAGSSETVGSITGAHTLLVPGATVTFWSAATGGTQLTDLLDMTNAAVTSVTTDANGAVPQLQGPDGTWTMWADANGGAGPRRMMGATDLTSLASTDLAAVTATAGVTYAWDYGYRPGGTAAANRAAIQNALNGLGSPGGTVFLPPGYGSIDATIVLPSRCTLRGAGHYATVLQLADTANCHMIANYVSSNGTTDPNGMFCGVMDLALDGRGAHQTTGGTYHGIYLTTNPLSTIGGADLAMDATHLIANVDVRNTYSDGIHSIGRSDTRITNCKVTVAGVNSFYVGFDTHVHGCVSEKPSQAGFVVSGSSTQLTNCKSYSAGQDASAYNGQTAVPNSGHGFVVTGSGIGEVTLTACDAQQVSGHGFHVTGGASAVVLAGCTTAECSYGNGTSFVSFNIDNATNVTVTGTSRVDNGFSSVRLAGGADRCDVMVAHALNAGATTLAAATSSDTVLLNNRVYVNGQPVSPWIATWAPSTTYTQGVILSYLGFVYQVTTAFTSGSSFSATNLKLLQAPLAGNPIPAGGYIFPGGGNNTATSSSLGTGTLRVFPFYLPHAATLTGIGAEVTTIGDSGSKYRLGVYADTGGFQPGSLLVDGGQIAGDSATVQTLTISQAAGAGVYWVGGVVQAVTTTQPTLRTTGPGAYALPMTSAPGAGGSAGGYSHSSTVSGALPSSFTVGGLIGSIPRIHVRA
jgi:hypothetical protein